MTAILKVKSISRPGETISSSGFESRAGGKGANQAVAIAKAGGSVDFIGIVGPNGKWLIDELHSHGVGVDWMVIVEVRNGHFIDVGGCVEDEGRMPLLEEP